MRKGCFYWLFIGFWLEPLIFILKLIFDHLLHPKVSNKSSQYSNCVNDFEEEDDFYSKSDVEDMIEDLKSDIEDDIRFKLEGEIREEIEKEYYGNGEKKKTHSKFARSQKAVLHEEEEIIMYDVEKGIYPPGEYLVGEDIETGKYLLTSRGNYGGIVTFYESYRAYMKDEDMKVIEFDGEYHLSLREKGIFIVVDCAEIKKL